MRELVIVGAGGFAREAAATVEACNDERPTWHLLGFVDDDPALQGRCIDGVTVLGPTDLVHELTDASVVVCIASPGRPTGREQLVDRLALPPERYATVVHPSCALGRGTMIGHGSVLLASVVTTAAVTIGAHNLIMPAVVLTHDDRTATAVTFGAGARLAGGVSVGESAYIGSGVLVREHLAIGARSVIGMGAVVVDDVPADEIWAGVPARRLRGRTLSDRAVVATVGALSAEAR